MQLIEPIAGTEATKAVMSAGERLIQQGVEEGVEKVRSLLLRQLEQRFGALSAMYAARVAAATSEELERWTLRVIPAERIEDVFAP